MRLAVLLLLPLLTACDVFRDQTFDEPEETFVIVEQMPEIVGGLQAIQSRVAYPEDARTAGVEGRVFVQFVVDEDGRAVEAIVVRGIHPACDAEALRVIRTASFVPGMQRGVPVRVRMSLSITFELG